MFKTNETSRLSWYGKLPIDLKNDKGEGKTTWLITKKKKKGRRTQNQARAMTKHLESPPQLKHVGNIKERNIDEDKYIYYKIELARNEASDPNERKKTGLMMQK